MDLQLVVVPVLMLAAIGYTWYFRNKMTAGMPEAFRLFFERTGYRYADIYDQPLEQHIMHGQTLVQNPSGHHVHMLRDYHGLQVHSEQDYSVVREGNKVTISRSASWWAPAQPRIRLQIAERSLTGAFKAVKEALGRSQRHWQQLYPVQVTTGDPELDGRFLFFGVEQNEVLHVLQAPGLKALLLGCVEVDLTVHADRVVFADPTQKNMSAGMGGYVGNLAMGTDMKKRMELTIPVHDRMAELLSIMIGAVS